MVDIQIAPSDYYKPNDPRWYDELSELDRELRRAAPDAVRSPEPKADDKGLAEALQVVLDLGSAGVLGAAVSAMSAWLGRRPRQRTLVVTWSGGADEGRIEIDGTNVDDEAITAALQRAVQETSKDA